MASSVLLGTYKKCRCTLKCNESSNRSRRNMGNLELKLCMTAKAPGVLSQYLIYVVPISGAVHEKALYKMGTSKLLRIV